MPGGIAIRGVIVPIGMTAIVLIVVVLLMTAAIIVTVALRFSFFSSARTFTIEFVNIANRPFSTAETLTHLMIEDRQFLEHAAESVVTGELTSDSVETGLVDYLSAYDLRFYSVAIKKDGAVLYSTDIGIRNRQTPRCGPAFEGICVSTIPGVSQPAGACGVGFVEIGEGENECPLDDNRNQMLCCSFDAPEYEKTERAERFPVIRCGATQSGVCNPQISGQGGRADFCPGATIKIEDDGLCTAGAPVCCVLLEEAFKERGATGTAQIPLFYKGEAGIIEVTIG